MDNFSLSDIRAVLDNDNEGFGGGSWWILLLFIVLFGGGNGFGFNGNRGQEQTAATLNTDFSILERKLDSIANGICQSSYENARLANQTDIAMLQGFNATQGQLADCCCTTQRAIDNVRYNAAQNTCEITNAVHQENEATRAAISALSSKLDQNEIQSLRDKVASMELNSALCGVVRYPLATTYNAGYNPYGCNPCGFNNNCCGAYGTTF